MRNLVVMLGSVLLLADLAAAQQPKTSIAVKLKGAVKGAVGNAATKAASASVDSLLGTGDTRLAGKNPCPPGTMPTGVSEATVGSEVVGQLKKKLAGGKDTTSKPTPGCVVNPGYAEQAALAQMQQAQAQAAAAANPAGALGAASAVAKATPIGMAVTAAPVAIKGVKALGGLFGKGQTKESMIKDLSKGRLELKGIKFIGASDALDEGFEDDFAALAEALQAIEGEFILNMPAEADDKAEPDTVMARRRLQKLSAQLAVVGIAEGRLALESHAPGLDAKRKAPKPGDAKVEIIRKPAEAKQ